MKFQERGDPMSTIEDELRKIITDRYGTLAEFSRKSKIPYTTIDSMLKRGIKNANVLNVLKVCDALNISVDKIKYGIIEPIHSERIERDDFYSEIKSLLNRDLSEEQQNQIVSFLEFVTKNNEK